MRCAGRFVGSALAPLGAVLFTVGLASCSGSGAGAGGGALPRVPAAPSAQARRAALPSQLLFVPTGNDLIDIYALRDPNKHGPLAHISAGLAGTQYQMTTDSAGDLFVVNDNFVKANEQYVSVYAPPYTGSPTILSGVTFPIGVAVAANGTVYVSNCGAYCSQVPAVYVYTGGSTTPTSSITSPDFSSLGGLALDAAGNLYVGEANRGTGASDVFEVPAGSTTPKPLHLKGLFNLGGPGVATVTADKTGDLFVGNNSNSTYLLEFKPGTTTAERIVDPFAFYDLPGMPAYGPDGNIYVPISCQNSGCEGSVLGFKPKGRVPFVTVGPSAIGVLGVATAPNGIFATHPSNVPATYLRCAHSTGVLVALASPSCVPPDAGGSLTAAMPFGPMPGRVTAREPALRLTRSVARRSGGWLSAQAASGKHLLYISSNGNGGSVPGAIEIYPEKGQTQAPIGSITNGTAAPEGIATDAKGNLFVANSGNNTVTVYPPGQTSPSVTYSNGIGTPYHVALGSDGTLYVANVSSTPSGAGSVTEYAPGSTNPKSTITNPSMSAVAVALDASNNLYVAWYGLSSGAVAIYKYPPGSTSGTNIGLDLPVPSFPVYALAFDHAGNLLLWYETLDHATKYLATFAPGATEPSRTVAGGSLLDIVSGIAVPKSTGTLYLAALNVNEGSQLSYPKGLPLDVIGLNLAAGIALSPGT